MYRQHHDHHNQDLVQDSDPRDSIGAKSTDTICSATTAGLGQLPVDVLYEVLKSLSVRDIVRLQRVSKRFCEITHERIVWANAYHLTTLPRPSGPHAWQDATSLKCHLIRSAKVEKSWPRRHVAPASVLDGAGSATSHDANADGGGAATREYYPTSTRKFTCPISRPITLKTVAGRWVVICTRTAIWCIDMEAEEQAGEGEPSWVSLHLCSTHIMMIWRRRHEATQTWECHIQAYPHPTLPIFSDIDTNSRAPANNNIPEIHLQLSHRGVCPVPMIFSGPALWDYEMERRTDGKTRSKGQGTRVLLIAYRTPPRLAAADLVLEPPPLSSSSCPSSYTTITTSSRSEPAAITCTLHDILVPTGSDSRRGLVPHFYTTSRGNESRGIIESSSSINRRDRDILGFTLSLDKLRLRLA
ncbi:hypothetical protein BS17DRAFT_815612 [Gyrodon lividus]|nr:hypothetical protein BS17DRAFT_815612 [Gyrodon lividus]